MSPLAKDLSDLPTPAKTSDDGCPPDPTPRFVHLLAEKWAADNEEAGPKPRATEDSRFRHSDAGKCSRAIAYAALEVPASDPMDLTGVWNTSLGTLIHDAWQAVLAGLHADAQIEPKVASVNGAGSGHIDAVLTFPGAEDGACPICGSENIEQDDPAPGEHTCRDCGEWINDDRKVCVELKTIGGFSYKMAVGERGTARGPKHDHLVQGCLNAKAAAADELVIAYLSKEAISVGAASRKGISELGRFCAEWTYTRAEFMPIADAEEARIAAILKLVDDGTLPARKIPDPKLPERAKIVDPAKGQWQEIDGVGGIVDAGSYWGCDYCRWQTVCAGTGSGRQPIAEVAVHLGLADEAVAS